MGTKRKLKLDMAQPASVLTATAVLIEKPVPTARWIIVTPALATRWLEENNWNNRPVRDDYVTRLAKDMTEGRWQGQNGEALRFDSAGRLVDGQHRLWACIVAKLPFETLVIDGVAPEAYATIGIGAKKDLKDFLGPMCGEKNVHVLGAVIRLVYMWQKGLLGNLKDGKRMPTIAELQQLLDEHPKLRLSADYASSHKALRRLVVSSFTALLHYAGHREGKPATVESFLERLGTGAGLEVDDPVYQLRKFLESQRGPQPGHRRTGREYVLALLIKTWNLSKANLKLRIAPRLQINEDFPKLEGL